MLTKFPVNPTQSPIQPEPDLYRPRYGFTHFLGDAKVRHSLKTIALSSLSLLSAAGAAHADEHQDFGDALTGGKFDINIRFRWEHVHQQGLSDGNALTVRPRVGYTTGKYHGASAKVSVQANAPADYGAYNAAGLNGQPTKGIIADPRDAGIDQLWFDYDFSELNDDLNVSARIGRQVITLDDHRFVGHVGWRNLWQTFDAATFKASPIDGLDVFYAYVWDVNRIFGPDSDRDFSSDSHLINVSYKLAEGHKLTGFGYFLDLESASGADAGSNQTLGLRYVGKSKLNEDVSLAYAASYANQSDYADAAEYDADYYAGELKALFGKTFVGAGIEVLGSDDGTVGFRTPLATLHKFNGFADKFLGTPAVGLRDYYVTAGTVIPDTKTKLVATYHYFTGDESGENYFGSEIDGVVVQPINDYAKALVKAAYFAGNDSAGGTSTDVFKLIAQIELTF